MSIDCNRVFDQILLDQSDHQVTPDFFSFIIFLTQLNFNFKLIGSRLTCQYQIEFQKLVRLQKGAYPQIQD